MSEKMIFCLGEGKFESKGDGYQKNNQVFNVQVTPKEFIKIKNNIPIIKLPLTVWRKKDEMTQEEKDNTSSWEQMGGYLKTQSYEDAWAEYWASASNEDKDKILNIPYFNPAIFKEITGIDVEAKTDLSDEDLIKELEKRGRLKNGKVLG